MVGLVGYVSGEDVVREGQRGLVEGVSGWFELCWRLVRRFVRCLSMIASQCQDHRAGVG